MGFWSRFKSYFSDAEKTFHKMGNDFAKDIESRTVGAGDFSKNVISKIGTEAKDIGNKMENLKK
jgi:hypothetical protein